VTTPATAETAGNTDMFNEEDRGLRLVEQQQLLTLPRPIARVRDCYAALPGIAISGRRMYSCRRMMLPWDYEASVELRRVDNKVNVVSMSWYRH